jgi:hypothetical protein
VGSYRYTTVGSISLNYGGTAIATVPINNNGNATIKKSGENELNINGLTMTLSGNKLLPVNQPLSNSFTQDGVVWTINGTATIQGTVSIGIITLNSTYSGTWSGQQGGTLLSGTISGTDIDILTKQ